MGVFVCVPYEGLVQDVFHPRRTLLTLLPVYPGYALDSSQSLPG